MKAIIIVIVMIVVFFIITIINLKTKKPEGCNEESLACSSCSYRCIYNKKNEEGNRK